MKRQRRIRRVPFCTKCQKPVNNHRDRVVNGTYRGVISIKSLRFYLNLFRR